MKELIGQGRTADIFRYDNNKVIKIFHNEFSHFAFEEFEKVKAINKIGLSTPQVYELMDIDTRKGIVYEYVHGISMIQAMQKHPFSINSFAKKLAEIHAEMHSKRVNGIESIKESLSTVITDTETLKQEDKKTIIDYIKTLPDGNTLCHYDYHPGNIIVSNHSFRVIDWMTAGAGNPCADVCRTGIILNSGILPPGISGVQKILIGSYRKKLYKKYIAHYCKLTGVIPDDIDKWLLPVAAGRLAEGIETEFGYLHKIISGKLNELNGGN